MATCRVISNQINSMHSLTKERRKREEMKLFKKFVIVEMIDTLPHYKSEDRDSERLALKRYMKYEFEISGK